MLVAWMRDNNANDWTVGIRFVLFRKNSAHRASFQRSQYEAMFSCKAKVGLTSTSFPIEVIERLQSEDNLIYFLSSPTSAEVTYEEGQTNPCPGDEEGQPKLCPGDNAQPTDQVHSSVQTYVDNRYTNINNQRWAAHLSQATQAHLSQAKQAERKVKRIRVDLKAAEPDDNVAVLILQVFM